MADTKLQDAVQRMADRLDRTMLRAIQRDGYVCAANVFENTNWSSDQLAAAVERCQQPVQQLHELLQLELQKFQTRVQRCAEDCKDKAQDSLPTSANPSDAQIARAQKGMEQCVGRCVDSHVSLLPTISARIEQAVAKVKTTQQQQH
ncbi:hypothetical protein PsorP6_017989 [Peronosclerospora sorghi]|uniref:Uncharacterized protein n=1 Tax=Peronosclerospora sorghi TaxID=230839 RepID=A0ACC0WCH0_9STRA|nr:hypothetical protein PsorP6_017989 [Peronosclerospora sorghi]